ncbi:hypothetical protein MLD38_010730 [Melastoma candidum]|uniref:Uncharacterized protein n=1 Tax=Melastoma candidum TaxID=119954 RepID=A0ACB9R0T5_9MYRT|nr:hypothetical protein MLD38_010730 [Melastoma candidum]
MAVVMGASAAVAIGLMLSLLSQLPSQPESAHRAFGRDSGQPQWHHGAFHVVRDSVRSNVHRMLHSRAEVPFQVPLEVNVVLLGFQGDGGYRFNMDAQKFEEFLRVSFQAHRPMCLETGEPIDIEHHIVYNAFHVGSVELLELEKALKGALAPAGTARESDFGREVPLFEVEATVVEPMFQKLYSYVFALEDGEYSASEIDRLMPNAIFILNFDKVRLDPRDKGNDPDAFRIAQLTEEDLKEQEGPCTYGKIETEEGSVSMKTLPRLRNIMYPKGFTLASDVMTHDMFTGRLAGVIATAVEHVKKMVHEGQEVVILGGSYSLHRHEKLAIAVASAMQGHSLHETKKDGRYHVHTKTYLDGAMLKEEMEHSADVLAAGLLEVADPSLSNKYFVRQDRMEESDKLSDSVLKHKSVWDTYDTNWDSLRKEERKGNKRSCKGLTGQESFLFVLSLADVDPELMMEDDSLVWTSHDVVIVLQHPNEKKPLSYVSETERRHALPYQA